MTNETFVETTVTYSVLVDDRLVIVENVPARVCVETGEQLFAPGTVERIQELVWGSKRPERFVQTPVLNFAA